MLRIAQTDTDSLADKVAFAFVVLLWRWCYCSSCVRLRETSESSNCNSTGEGETTSKGTNKRNVALPVGTAAPNRFCRILLLRCYVAIVAIEAFPVAVVLLLVCRFLLC